MFLIVVLGISALAFGFSCIASIIQFNIPMALGFFFCAWLLGMKTRDLYNTWSTNEAVRDISAMVAELERVQEWEKMHPEAEFNEWDVKNPHFKG